MHIFTTSLFLMAFVLHAKANGSAVMLNHQSNVTSSSSMPKQSEIAALMVQKIENLTSTLVHEMYFALNACNLKQPKAAFTAIETCLTIVETLSNILGHEHFRTQCGTHVDHYATTFHDHNNKHLLEMVIALEQAKKNLEGLSVNCQEAENLLHKAISARNQFCTTCTQWSPSLEKIYNMLNEIDDFFGKAHQAAASSHKFPLITGYFATSKPSPSAIYKRLNNLKQEIIKITQNRTSVYQKLEQLPSELDSYLDQIKINDHDNLSTCVITRLKHKRTEIRKIVDSINETNTRSLVKDASFRDPGAATFNSLTRIKYPQAQSSQGFIHNAQIIATTIAGPLLYNIFSTTEITAIRLHRTVEMLQDIAKVCKGIREMDDKVLKNIATLVKELKAKNIVSYTIGLYRIIEGLGAISEETKQKIRQFIVSIENNSIGLEEITGLIDTKKISGILVDPLAHYPKTTQGIIGRIGSLSTQLASTIKEHLDDPKWAEMHKSLQNKLIDQQIKCLTAQDYGALLQTIAKTNETISNSYTTWQAIEEKSETDQKYANNTQPMFEQLYKKQLLHLTQSTYQQKIEESRLAKRRPWSKFYLGLLHDIFYKILHPIKVKHSDEHAKLGHQISTELDTAHEILQKKIEKYELFIPKSVEKNDIKKFVSYTFLSSAHQTEKAAIQKKIDPIDTNNILNQHESKDKISRWTWLLTKLWSLLLYPKKLFINDPLHTLRQELEALESVSLPRVVKLPVAMLRLLPLINEEFASIISEKYSPEADIA